MKVLMYAPIFPPLIGGPATQCSHLCRVLVQRGIKPVVLTVGERFGAEQHTDGYIIYRYPWRYTGTPLDKVLRWLVFPGYLVWIVHKERPDVIHAHAVSALSFVVGVYARLWRIPSVIKFAGDWVWETLSTHALAAQDLAELKEKYVMARILTLVERVGVGQFTVQWAPSSFRKENIVELMGNRARVVQIPNALDLPNVERYQKKEHAGVRVVSANRFIPHKRVALIAEMFARIAGPDDTLVLIGTGADEEVQKVKETVARLGCANRIQLLGRLSSEEVYAQFAQSDVYVSASLEEGYPNVFIEAMHFGLPIVSTDVGGCREMVIHEETGFLTPVENDDALERALQMLMTDSVLRARMTEAARASAKQYNLHIVVDRFIDMYTSLVQKQTS